MAIERIIGILGSDHVASALSEATVKAAIEQLSGDGAVKIEAISADSLDYVPNVDLLIYATGRSYCDTSWRFVHDYFRTGGHVLTVGTNPLTEPYRVVGSEVVCADTTDAAWHSIGLVDTCLVTGPFAQPEAKDISPRFDFLNTLPLPAMAATCAMDVRLATKPEPKGELYSGHGEREADLEVGCHLHDAAGRAVTSPIIRLNHFDGGCVTCLNFDPADKGYWDSADGQMFVAGVIGTCLAETWHVDVTSKYSRYMPDESVELLAVGRRLAGAIEGDHVLVLTLHDADCLDVAPVVSQKVEISHDSFEFPWSVVKLDEGCYTVRGQLCVGGQCVQQWQTGFYVASVERARAIAEKAPRMTVDASVSPDFCVVNGKPFPMTGTTYMARDNYRDCFAELNVAYARPDLKALREMGANIIRAGVWTTYYRVYDPAGGFTEEALRSLDAYFLCAADAGLPVQFVPSAFLMTCWDRSGSPFHNEDLRAKGMLVFKQFAERYADWPGVQLDMINEPSYAPLVQGQLWQTARPIGDPNELVAWQEWLKNKYNDDLGALHAAWSVSAVEVPDFDAPELPIEVDFKTNYDGPPVYTRRAMVADFYAFADDSFTDWTTEIRQIVREAAPNMVVMLGRDEWFRVPSQQRDAYEGNLDIVNWHQWHWEGTIFNEHNLNRVRGMVCCGQEMGVLPYKDQRNEERLDEYDIHHQLERKLMYCMGNWIQWQSHSDPVMDIYKETKLGLIRVDGTERPAMSLLRLVGWLEERMAGHVVGRREELERLMMVVPTSVWKSSDKHLAQRSTLQGIHAISYRLNQRVYCVLESLLRSDNDKQIGDPALMILPSATMLSQPAWDELLRRVREYGATLLVTGSVEQDEFWRRRERLADIGIDVVTENMATVERIRIDGRWHDCTFREAIQNGLPGKGLLRSVPGDAEIAEVIEKPLGKGRIVYCPVPVELADDIGATVDLYRSVIASCGSELWSPIRVAAEDNKVGQLVYAVDYRDAIAINLINEGTAGACRFRLVESGVNVEAELERGRAARIYVDRKGTLLGGYIHAPLQVGETRIVPSGDLAFARTSDGWSVMAGVRSGDACTIDDETVTVGAFCMC